MPFPVIFKRSTSEPVKLDKEAETLITLTGVLKDDCSIIDPIILVEASLDVLATANYMTIDKFKRSYFITDIVSETTNLLRVSGHVDVLSSFAQYIRGNKGIVFRQQEDWNLYLNDGVLEIYQNPIVTTHLFPNGFSGQSYVLALAGKKAASEYGWGVIPGGGGGGEYTKTCGGLREYALAQIGNPYWFGTFGQIASQTLYDNRKAAYPDKYTDTDYSTQFGQRVHDCVGLIKGYRWSDTPSSTPTYNAAQDVDVKGLLQSCTRIMGFIGDPNWNSLYQAYAGICIFNQDLSHTGVYMGDGTVIEARSHAYGVVRTNITDTGRTWYRYGIPDWLLDSTGIPPL